MITPAHGPTAAQMLDWGLDPAWSRMVEFTTPDGTDVRWHILDNGADPVHGTLVCTHGNPTWSYIWRDLLAQAPTGWRVVAVDQTGMGFSGRGTPRILAERIGELVAFCNRHTPGPVAMAAHDWGGPVTIGAAAQLDCRALVLTNTAVGLPDGVRMPPLIALARSAATFGCERTPAFVGGTARMTDRQHRDALRAPYRGRARRHAVAEFVADIPVGPTDPSWMTLQQVARDLDSMTCPVLLAWGGRDPVFHHRFLADLVARVPHAQVQVFASAAHLVTLDAPVADLAWTWLQTTVPDLNRSGQDLRDPAPHDAAPHDPAPHDPAPHDAAPHDLAPHERVSPAGPVASPGGDAEPEAGVSFAAVTARLVARSSDTSVAYRGPGGPRSWQELSAHAHRIASQLVADGLVPGDRVALLVPPSADCLAAAYGIWLAGGVVVAVDAQIGLRPMRRLMRAATVQWAIGTARTARLARVVGLTPGARHMVVPEPPGPAVGPTHAGITLPDLLPDAMAAVVHTSGATGPAKPVVYTHGALAAQRDAMLEQFPMGAFTTSFAPFTLVGPALGLTCSLPADVTPGALDFDAFAAASAGTTTAWLSPAAAQRVVDTAGGRTAPMDLIMLAGAPVPAALVKAVEAITGADVRAPYGMTEAMPLTDGTTPAATGPHGGTCTGRPLTGVEVVIADLDTADLDTADLNAADLDTAGPNAGQAATGTDISTLASTWGEILVSAAWMRAGYDRRWGLTRDATVTMDGTVFHRTGDVGYLDATGRLFQLGRALHVIATPAGPLPCVVPEQAVLSATGRSAAAVGVGPVGTQALVVVLDADSDLALADLPTTAAVRSACATPVAAVLTGRLPVDIRHRTKVDRVALAADAARLLAGR